MIETSQLDQVQSQGEALLGLVQANVSQADGVSTVANTFGDQAAAMTANNEAIAQLAEVQNEVIAAAAQNAVHQQNDVVIEEMRTEAGNDIWQTIGRNSCLIVRVEQILPEIEAMEAQATRLQLEILTSELDDSYLQACEIAPNVPSVQTAISMAYEAERQRIIESAPEVPLKTLVAQLRAAIDALHEAQEPAYGLTTPLPANHPARTVEIQEPAPEESPRKNGKGFNIAGKPADEVIRSIMGSIVGLGMFPTGTETYTEIAFAARYAEVREAADPVNPVLIRNHVSIHALEALRSFSVLDYMRRREVQGLGWDEDDLITLGDITMATLWGMHNRGLKKTQTAMRALRGEIDRQVEAYRLAHAPQDS